jgi:hypothetical protein
LVGAEERFFQELATGIITAGGDRFDAPTAAALAHQAWAELLQIGTDAFPCLWAYSDDLRFIYQWDEDPPMLVILLWDDEMWRDMVRIRVPTELAQ